jgi:hypothetical protein
MSRYIDAELVPSLFDEEYKKTRKLISEGETHLDNLAEGFTEAGRVIRTMPTADVVEVVRCKDCKWWKRMNGDKRLQCFHGHGLIRTTENDYCSRGERREG